MTRYAVKNESLVPWVKFIWRFEDENADIHNKLLPTDSIDIVLNLADQMVYETGGERILAPPVHINGLRSGHSYVYQSGLICVYGIALNSYGLFPFVHKPLNCIRNRIVDLEDLSPSLHRKLREAVTDSNKRERIHNIETALCSELSCSADYRKKAQQIDEFVDLEDSLTVLEYCAKQGINVKTFERFVLRYTGYTPIMLRRIKRFQSVANQLVHQSPDSLIDLAYSNRYSDQAHFIKEFRQFSGKAPRTFQGERESVKENTKYDYR